jgi:hypothetical protein
MPGPVLASTTSTLVEKKGVDRRDKRGHDDAKALAY